MDIEQLKKILLLNEENENLEYKTASKSYSILGHKNGKIDKRSVLGYCVGLANEGGGKLILGVEPKPPHKIVGSAAVQDIGEVKKQIYSKIGLKVGVHEVFDDQGKRVIIIEIPGRPRGQAMKFHGVPLMRIDEELREMDDQTLKKILTEDTPDWSAQICSNAQITDLDETAIHVARENFKKKNLRIADEVDQWDDMTFLNKAKITIKGGITNTAIILLGKSEASTLISPNVARITWILKDEAGAEKDYDHFSCPLLLNVEEVYKKIRNLKYRYIQDDSLFPEEVMMYEPYVIREALHNCIAHQDYSYNERITLVESESGHLIFTNKGEFLPGTVESVIEADSPQAYYKNNFLSEAMVNLNMIDIVGSGIKKMFTIQKERFFPMPTYEFDNNQVKVTIYGKILDINYAKILAKHKELSLVEILLLDRIQKGKQIRKESARILRGKKLIEGRYPTIFLSEELAKSTGEMAEYIKNRGFHSDHYKSLIKEFLQKNPGASRDDINNLLFSLLPKVLTDEQKIRRIGNLLTNLSTKEKSIINKGTNRSPSWELNN